MQPFDEYNLIFDHVEKLLDRRQAITAFYISVNTGISAAIGFLFNDNQITQLWEVGVLLLLLSSGIMVCHTWRGLLQQYECLLDWWYGQLREIENKLPSSMQVVNREYKAFYLVAEGNNKRKKPGLTGREVKLTWIFTALYCVFGIGTLWITIISIG